MLSNYLKPAFGGRTIFFALMMILFKRLALTKIFPQDGPEVGRAIVSLFFVVSLFFGLFQVELKNAAIHLDHAFGAWIGVTIP